MEGGVKGPKVLKMTKSRSAKGREGVGEVERAIRRRCGSEE